MTGASEDAESPAPLYVITGGRSRAARGKFELLTVIESVAGPPLPQAQVEAAAILRLCRTPAAVVEIAGHLRLPVGVVKIFLDDLLTARRITVHPPPATRPSTRTGRRGAPPLAELPDPGLLRKVLDALHTL